MNNKRKLTQLYHQLQTFLESNKLSVIEGFERQFTLRQMHKDLYGTVHLGKQEYTHFIVITDEMVAMYEQKVLEYLT